MTDETLTEAEGVSVPPGKPQGGWRSEAGRAAYWRMRWESAVGALADLIAEHTETVDEMSALRERLARVANPVSLDHAACSCGLRVLDHDVAGEPCGESSAQALATWLTAALAPQETREATASVPLVATPWPEDEPLGEPPAWRTPS